MPTLTSHGNEVPSLGIDLVKSIQEVEAELGGGIFGRRFPASLAQVEKEAPLPVLCPQLVPAGTWMRLQ